MAITIPIGAKEKLVGTGFFAGKQGNTFALVTSLHLLGNGQDFRAGIPPHGGDMSRPQNYPLQTIPALPAELVVAEHLLDIAILLIRDANIDVPLPRFVDNPEEIHVGEDVLIVGYPFTTIGSLLETVEPCSISALGNRILPNGARRFEYVVSHQTHPGSSGSPLIRKSDGAVCGVIRGCLAPPGVVSIGNIPIGTDTNITFATSAYMLPELIDYAFAIRGIKE